MKVLPGRGIDVREVVLSGFVSSRDPTLRKLLLVVVRVFRRRWAVDRSEGWYPVADNTLISPPSFQGVIRGMQAVHICPGRKGGLRLSDLLRLLLVRLHAALLHVEVLAQLQRELST